MVNKHTMEVLKDSILGGASAGGTMEVINDSPILDDPAQDMALKIIVSVFSAFVVPAVRSWLRKRKENRAKKKVVRMYDYPNT